MQSIIAVLLWATAALGQEDADVDRADSRFMATVLARLAQRADPIANIYLNQALVEGLSSLLEQPMSAVKRLNMRLRIAQERVRAGDLRAGIEELQGVLVAVEAGQVPATEGFVYMLHDQLAIAYLRLGEQENCLRNHTTNSCLLPIRDDGIHTLQEGSRRAIEHYTINLNKRPSDLGTRWLLNLAYMTLGEYPEGVPEPWRIPPRVFAGDSGGIQRFRDVAPAAGVAAVGLAGGSAVEDFDGDGLLDIAVSSWGLRDPLRYFHNEGNGAFTEATTAAGLDGQIGGINLEQADYDNDGDVDLLVLRGAWMGEEGRMPNSLLRNNGDGTFVDVTRRAGLFSLHPTHAAAFADYDNDGWLDLFVGNESGKQPHPCQLFRNQGDGRFVDVAPAVGVNHAGFVKGVAWGDIDNDGLIDLYVSQFYRENVLYRNLGDTPEGWRFAAAVVAPGAERELSHLVLGLRQRRLARLVYWRLQHERPRRHGARVPRRGIRRRSRACVPQQQRWHLHRGHRIAGKLWPSHPSYGRQLRRLGQRRISRLLRGHWDSRSALPSRPTACCATTVARGFWTSPQQAASATCRKGTACPLQTSTTMETKTSSRSWAEPLQATSTRTCSMKIPDTAIAGCGCFPKECSRTEVLLAAACACACGNQTAVPATSTTSSVRAAALGPTRSRRTSVWGTPRNWYSWKSLGRRPIRRSAGRD